MTRSKKSFSFTKRWFFFHGNFSLSNEFFLSTWWLSDRLTICVMWWRCMTITLSLSLVAWKWIQHDTASCYARWVIITTPLKSLELTNCYGYAFDVTRTWIFCVILMSGSGYCNERSESLSGHRVAFHLDFFFVLCSFFLCCRRKKKRENEVEKLENPRVRRECERVLWWRSI